MVLELPPRQIRTTGRPTHLAIIRCIRQEGLPVATEWLTKTVTDLQLLISQINPSDGVTYKIPAVLKSNL